MRIAALTPGVGTVFKDSAASRTEADRAVGPAVPHVHRDRIRDRDVALRTSDELDLLPVGHDGTCGVS